MNVSVVDLSANQKKLLVEIPAEKVQKELRARYRDLGKSVKIKGFRPGKVPLNILKSYYGKNVQNEVSSQFIQETFPEALRETDLKPLVEADVSEMRFEENGAFTYAAVVDICPPFELADYRGLNIHRERVEIDEKVEEAELEGIRQQHAQLHTVETERVVQEGDVVLIDFTPWLDEVVFQKGSTHDYMTEVGKKAIHPELDAHLVGRLAGDSFSVELDYPEDAPIREIAGKRIRADVVIKEVKEKIVPELNDEFAREVGRFHTLDDLRKTIREQLVQREESRISSEVRRQIVDKLVGQMEVELSPRVIEREIDYLIGHLQHQFESQGLKIDTSRFNTPEVRADYRSQAERNVRWRLIVQKIAERENLQLSEEEREDIYREVARLTRTDLETIKRDYADSSIIEQYKDGRIVDKVFRLIESEAVFSNTTEEQNQSNQE